MELRKPIRSKAKEPSQRDCSVREVIPVLRYRLDFVKSVSAQSHSQQLKVELMDTVSNRVEMLLGTDMIPLQGGKNFASVEPNEFTIAAYLIPRRCRVTQASYGYTESSLSTEMDRLFKEHVGQGSLVIDEEKVDDICEQSCTPMDTWLLNTDTTIGNGNMQAWFPFSIHAP